MIYFMVQGHYCIRDITSVCSYTFMVGGRELESVCVRITNNRMSQTCVCVALLQISVSWLDNSCLMSRMDGLTYWV